MAETQSQIEDEAEGEAGKGQNSLGMVHFLNSELIGGLACDAVLAPRLAWAIRTEASALVPHNPTLVSRLLTSSHPITSGGLRYTHMPAFSQTLNVSIWFLCILTQLLHHILRK